MSTHGIFRPPSPYNEPVRSYAPGSPERDELQRRLQQMQGERIEIPCVIGGSASQGLLSFWQKNQQ